MRTERSVSSSLAMAPPTMTWGVSGMAMAAVCALGYAAPTGADATELARAAFGSETVASEPITLPSSALTGERGAWAHVEAAARAEAFEDGVSHPAEPAFEQFLARYGDTHLAQLMMARVSEDSARFALMLRLAGRMEAIGRATRLELVEAGLRSSSFDVRDAAIQAAESWENAELAPILARHAEPVPWLAEYITRLIRDLTG